ncbi:MAG: hypothetical protein O7H41_01245 [Planctomycetota bacterium]|nr:hypothetical protein [Planctomycetota bacterium]
MDREEMMAAMREVLSEELGPSEVDMAEKWEGGEIVIRSGRGTPREKRLPIESFFRKIVMLRDRLRIVEQKINSNRSLSAGEKITLQQYITKAYGTLTTFNFLFRDRDDHFTGERKPMNEILRAGSPGMVGPTTSASPAAEPLAG